MRSPVSFNGVVLEEICPACKGYPPHHKWFSTPYCDNCSNIGFILTEQGRAIGQLVASHLKGNDSAAGLICFLENDI